MLNTPFKTDVLSQRKPARFALIAIFSLILPLYAGQVDCFADTSVTSDISADTTWTVSGSPYVIGANIAVVATKTLTIENGVTVKFDGNYKLTIDGAIVTQGTSTDPVIFTSNNSSPAGGDWQSIQIGSSAGTSSFDYTIFEGATYGIHQIQSTHDVTNCTFQHNVIGVLLQNGSSPDITGNTFAHNQTGIGILGATGAVSNPVIDNNIFYGQSSYNIQADNTDDLSSLTIDAQNNWWGTNIAPKINTKIVDNSDNGVLPVIDTSSPQLLGEAVFGNISTTTWTTTESPYIVMSDLLVDGGNTLTIDPGVAVKFNGIYQITVAGTLDAVGTDTSLIHFTSNQASPAANDWGYVYLGPNSSNSQIEYAKFEYAQWGVLQEGQSQPITNSEFHNNLFGIVLTNGASPDITGNDISGNTAAGIAIFGGTLGPGMESISNPVINNNTIDNPLGWNIYAASMVGDISSTTIDAKNNWWGTTDPSVIAGRIYDYEDEEHGPVVDYSGYLNGAGGVPAGPTEVSGTVAEDTAWIPFGSPYIVTGDVLVASGKMLTIDPGVEVKFDGSYKLEGVGVIDAGGTQADPITFTSNQTSPAAGDWVSVISKNNSSSFDYVIINYAQAGLILDGITNDVSNSVFQQNQIGLQLEGATSSIISANSISNNTNYGINIVGKSGNTPSPVINGNEIFNNSNYDINTTRIGTLFNQSGNVVNAEMNWWGTNDPIQISGSIRDFYDQAFLPRVDYAPYLTAAAGYNINITNNSVSQRFFDPINQQTTVINYTLDVDADVTIKIYNYDTGNLVRTLVSMQSRTAGAKNESWDGKDDSSQTLPYGSYTYIIDAQASGGLSGRYDPILFNEIGPVLSDVSILSPAGNFSGFKGDRLEIDYTLDTFGLVTLKYDFDPIISNQPRPAGVNKDTWNGRDLSGTIVVSTENVNIKAETRPLPENIIVLQKSIPDFDISELSSNPYVIRPLYNEITNINYAITESADVTVAILSPDGTQTIVVLEQAVSKTAGSYPLIWDGRTLMGETIVEEGDYIIKVEAEDGQGVTVERLGNIKVLY